jgi:hypothetical protein
VLACCGARCASFWLILCSTTKKLTIFFCSSSRSQK